MGGMGGRLADLMPVGWDQDPALGLDPNSAPEQPGITEAARICTTDAHI